MDSLLLSSSSPPIDWGNALDCHHSWIRKVVNARVISPQDVNDVLQEISAAVLRTAPRPEDPHKVAPSLCGVAVRQASQFLRKHTRQERLH
jgi:DNA-directed RNA polymerase specialized sigma24 family protein